MSAITIDKTIKTAMENIESHHFVLPAIQRKFVWSPEQIEMLFDSIMRDYPINAFMLCCGTWRTQPYGIPSSSMAFC